MGLDLLFVEADAAPGKDFPDFLDGIPVPIRWTTRSAELV